MRRMVAEHLGANEAESEFKKIHSLNVKYPGVPNTKESAHFERVLFCLGRQAFVEKRMKRLSGICVDIFV